MSYGRTQGPSSTSRDINNDFLNAYKEEYAAYVAAGDTDRAGQVADVLAGLGHQVVVKQARPVEGDKETAVSAEAVETAVEAPKRRGRPRKNAEEASEAE